MSDKREGGGRIAATSTRLSFEATKLPLGEGLSTQDTHPGQAGGSFMQTAFWAKFKADTGWSAFRLGVRLSGGDFGDTVFALARPLALGQWFVYVPHGPTSCPPGIDPGDYLAALAEQTLPLMPRRPLFFRFDIPWEKDSPDSIRLKERVASRSMGLRKGEAVQVPDTTVVDLRLSEAELLENMKPKWRYNIRLAEKKGVKAERHGYEALDEFYKLYQITAKRDGIAIHPKSYYARLLQTEENKKPADAGRGSPVAVWLATHEDEALAAIITIFIGKQAVYLYGASSDKKRNLMPAYALQWAAIKAAKASGCEEYDFFGIPPEADPGHAMAGLYQFKTGFGGKIVHRLGSVDLPVKPWAYAAFSFVERMRLFWHKKIVKKVAAIMRSIKQGA